MIGIGLTVENEDDPWAAAARRDRISMIIDFVAPVTRRWWPRRSRAAVDAEGLARTDTEASVGRINSLNGSERAASAATWSIAAMDRGAGDPVRRVLGGRVCRPNVGCEIYAPSAPLIDLVPLCPK